MLSGLLADRGDARRDRVALLAAAIELADLRAALETGKPPVSVARGAKEGMPQVVAALSRAQPPAASSGSGDSSARARRTQCRGAGIVAAKRPKRLLERTLLLADCQVELVAAGADAGQLDRSLWGDGDVT
jgi:hypothetical protein